MFANASRRSRAHVDVPLILMVFAMCFFGIYAVCVATYSINSTATNLLEHIWNPPRHSASASSCWCLRRWS